MREKNLFGAHPASTPNQDIRSSTRGRSLQFELRDQPFGGSRILSFHFRILNLSLFVTFCHFFASRKASGDVAGLHRLGQPAGGPTDLRISPVNLPRQTDLGVC